MRSYDFIRKWESHPGGLPGQGGHTGGDAGKTQGWATLSKAVLFSYCGRDLGPKDTCKDSTSLVKITFEQSPDFTHVERGPKWGC